MEIRSFQNELTRLETAKKQRLEKLKAMDPHAFQMVNWLRTNKHIFKGKVFEPVMLEVNVLNPKHSMYLESIISRRDKVAFGCTEKSDMTLFIKVLRENHWKCNIFHCNNNSSRFVPAIPIEQLRRFGFYSYLNSLFTAPEPVKNHLCKMYRLHQIPVGTEVTNRTYNDVPRNISLFFSGKFLIKFLEYQLQ